MWLGEIGGRGGGGGGRGGGSWVARGGKYGALMRLKFGRGVLS